MINHFLSHVKDNLKGQSARLLKPFGIEMLSARQSDYVLSDYRIYVNGSQRLSLNQVTDVVDPEKVLFKQKDAVTAPAYVWRYPVVDQDAHLLRSGNILVGGRVLNTDFGNNALLKDVLKFSKRPPLEASTLIAPWSHYWSGYYDYLIFVAAKLYRIKKVLPASEFANAVVAYPLLNTPFERELLDLLECEPGNVIDSRMVDVRFDRCVLGNSGSWFYPNVADLVALKGYLATKVIGADEAPTRLYISRSGRRRVTNEDELIRLLETYNFTVVDDKPRSIAEQYRLYNNAQFIIGPHGASFANILWCEPGTHLFELFANDYMPEYFRYMAQVLGLRYTAYCYGDGSAVTSHHSRVDKDVHVSIPEVDRCLNQIFKSNVIQ